MLIDSSMRVYLNNNLFVCFNSVYGVELSYPVHNTAKASHNHRRTSTYIHAYSSLKEFTILLGFCRTCIE